MRPSTTFGGGSEQGTPPPSLRTSGPAPSSHSMRSQLSNGTSRTHGTNYEAAVYDGRSSRTGSVSAAALGPTIEPLPAWSVAAPGGGPPPHHPYATPPMSSYSQYAGSEASNPPSRRTSHENPPSSSRRTSHEDSSSASSPYRADMERKLPRLSALPPPRPAPAGGLPPTPPDMAPQRLPKKRHGSSPSGNYPAAYPYAEASPDSFIDRSKPPVTGPSSYRDRNRRVSAPPAAYQPHPGSASTLFVHDPFTGPPSTLPRSTTEPDYTSTLNRAHTARALPPISSNAAPTKRQPSMKKSHVTGNPQDSPFASFLSFDTPDSSYATLPPTTNIRQLPAPPSDSLPAHIVRPLPPIGPSNY